MEDWLYQMGTTSLNKVTDVRYRDNVLTPVVLPLVDAITLSTNTITLNLM